MHPGTSGCTVAQGRAAMGRVSGAAAPGSPCRFADSQAVGGFNQYRESSLGVSEALQMTTVSPDRIGPC